MDEYWILIDFSNTLIFDWATQHNCSQIAAAGGQRTVNFTLPLALTTYFISLGGYTTTAVYTAACVSSFDASVRLRDVSEKVAVPAGFSIKIFAIGY